MKLQLFSPLDHQIYQQNTKNQAIIRIKGRVRTFFKSNKHFDLSYQVLNNENNELIKWTSIEIEEDNTFQDNFLLNSGGLYNLIIKLREINNNKEKITEIKIGIGELFIIAGQSNSANHGDAKQICEDGRILAFDGKKWRIANDPQKTATGIQGSPWPPFANNLIKHINVPIGLISVGVGGSSVEEWLPCKGRNYIRLENALGWIKKQNLGGLRAILWHQGESDTLSKTPAETYSMRLKEIINQTRKDLNSDVNWVIALVSFLPDGDNAAMLEILKGQKNLENHKNIFLGPNTDEIRGLEYRYDYLHFNDRGLKKHGKMWAKIIKNLFF